jgi:hypothetical protein
MLHISTRESDGFDQLLGRLDVRSSAVTHGGWGQERPIT